MVPEQAVNSGDFDDNGKPYVLYLHFCFLCTLFDPCTMFVQYLVCKLEYSCTHTTNY